MISFFKQRSPVIRERTSHCLSRTDIDPDALKVLYRLANTGYTAYLVGGSVRDLLLGRQPKDFDLGTDARPNEIRRLFRNCFLIGRRFRLAHVVFGKKVVETSTFRRQPDATEGDAGLYQTEDNTFGTPEEDAKRRDFTVNGLFYDIKTFAVIDYVGGLKDLERRTLRCIGDPDIRFREDPVRMMRAVKFAARLGFVIDRTSCKAILKHHADILNASLPRVCEEIFRLFTYQTSRHAFTLLWEFKLLHDLLPEVGAYVDATGGKKSPLWSYLAAFDADPANANLPNGVRIACLYYPLFLAKFRQEETRCPGTHVNRQHVARQALYPIAQQLHIPKATFFTAVALMDAPRRFAESPRKGKVQRFLHHPGFPEMLSFQRILLVAEKGDLSVVNEWQALYEQSVTERGSRPRWSDEGVPAEEDGGPPRDAEEDGEQKPRRRSRRHGPRKRRPASEATGQPKITVAEVGAREAGATAVHTSG